MRNETSSQKQKSDITWPLTDGLLLHLCVRLWAAVQRRALLGISLLQCLWVQSHGGRERPEALMV